MNVPAVTCTTVSIFLPRLLAKGRLLIQVADIGQSEVANGWLEPCGFSDESVEGISPRSKENYLITVLTLFNGVIAKRYPGSANPATAISKPKIKERCHCPVEADTNQFKKRLVGSFAGFSGGQS